MARVITTVTTTVKDKIPYHFICNYCGCRNDKFAQVTGVHVGGRENTGAALLDLYNEPKRYREKIKAYGDRLRGGDNLLSGKYDAVNYSTQSLLTLGLDGKCAHCGREQAWAIDPSAPDNRWRSGCLSMLVFIAIGLALFLIGAIAVTDATWSTVLMVLGSLVWVGGILGGVIVSLVRNRRALKNNLAALAAAPNDPEKLPVIDVPEAGNPFDMWQPG